MSHDPKYWVPRASEDAHTPVASRDPRTRCSALVYEPDEIELACPMCVLVYVDGT